MKLLKGSDLQGMFFKAWSDVRVEGSHPHGLIFICYTELMTKFLGLSLSC